MKLKELREKRGELLADARALVDKADAEKRALTTEEDAKYSELFTKATEIRASIEREEQLQAEERSAAEQALRDQDAAKDVAKGKPTDPEARLNPRASEEYRNAFSKFLVEGKRGLRDNELRDLQADSDSAGGYLVTPQQFVQELIKGVDNQVLIRQRARKFSLPTAASMGAPRLTADPDDADWTAEIATGSEDSAMAFGLRELHPHPLAKRIKISDKLSRMFTGIDALVRDRLAYKFAVSQEKSFLTGSGSNQPLGVFTASSNGISTSRDVSTGNAATAPTFDGLISAKYALKGDYWNRADWIFHRDVLAVISKLKDGEGQYIWRDSVRDGEPDRLLGRPVFSSEYAPNTMTSSLYVGILGDFSNYWIADALDMRVKVLDQLYAESDQIGYIGRMESDGMPVLEEAFARVKLG